MLAKTECDVDLGQGRFFTLLFHSVQTAARMRARSRRASPPPLVNNGLDPRLRLPRAVSTRPWIYFKRAAATTTIIIGRSFPTYDEPVREMRPNYPPRFKSSRRTVIAVRPMVHICQCGFATAKGINFVFNNDRWFIEYGFLIHIK